MSEATRGLGKDSPDVELCLTAVRVDFLGRRPDTKIKVFIDVNNQEYNAEIVKGGDVQWSGIIRCRAHSNVVVRLEYRSRLMTWRRLASIRASLSDGVSPIADDNHIISVTFVISTPPGPHTLPDDIGRVSPTAADSDVIGQVGAAKLSLQNQKVIVDKLGRFWAILGVIKSVGESLSELHPAVAVAFSALNLLIEACEKQQACRDAALELVTQFEPFLSIERHIQELQERKESRRAVEEMLGLISGISNYFFSQTSSSIVGNLFGDEYKKTLSQFKVEFARAKESFDRSIQLEVFKAVHGIEGIVQLGFLHDKLSECEEAHFKSGEGHVCLDETRVDLRHRIVDWIDDRTLDQPGVLWLRGKAGSGKSTVANTVAQVVEDRGYNLSCFLCRRDDENLSQPRRLLCTLAYRFAQQHESYRAAIFHLLHTDTRGAGIAATLDVDTQFDRLFKVPLAQTVDPLRPHVVIIDALDECGSPRQQASLARCLLALSRTVGWIKVFITSRDEPSIHNILAAKGTRCVQYNIDDESGVEGDIRHYIISQADALELQLSDDHVTQLVKRADGLFIWCSTLFKYLSKRLVPREALESFLSGEEPHGSWDQLYRLYDKVVDSALLSSEDVPFMRAVLATINVVASNRPMSTSAIAAFLCDRGQYKGSLKTMKDRAEIVIKKLHAVLYVDESMNAGVRAHHISFYDYLTEKSRVCPDDEWERPDQVHRRINQNCIEILHKELQFNICKIGTPILNRDIQDLSQRVAENISEELQYSTCFWSTHLSHFLPSVSIEAEVAPVVLKLLCSKRLLFWLETLSLQGLLKQSLVAFETCSNVFQNSPNIVAAAKDAHKFVRSFAPAMESISHIYLSALFWLPEDSLTYRNLMLSQSRHGQVISHKPKNWDKVVWERTHHEGFYSVAYSPDGRFIASGGHGGSVYIWDAQTGSLERPPLRGHEDKVLYLAFSPDGRFIVSGSLDGTMRVWDVEAEESISRFGSLLSEHGDHLLCIALSPDGKSVAARVDPCTVQVWNIRTGTPEGEHLRHSGHVWAVAYSPDAQYIATGRSNGEIHIWSAGLRQEIQAFRAHWQPVHSVAYSPNGYTIVSSSSDQTIRVWDAKTYQPIGQPLRGHTDWVWSATYSQDGRFILSSGRDHIICVWDASSGDLIGAPVRDNSNYMFFVSLSPDNLCIVCASSDRAVRVWLASDNSTTDVDISERTVAVRALAFSPDSCFIASGHKDNMVRIWDALSGALVGQLKGHRDHVQSVAYSPDGRFLASGADDRTVRIWDVRMGTTVVSFQPRGYYKSVLSVIYSPDGHIVASATGSGYFSNSGPGTAAVCLWDPQTGASLGKPLQIHSNGAWTIAFSPDNRFISCGSSLGTIWIWDITNGGSVAKIIQAHSDMVKSVAFSPDGRYIASGSADCSVRVWDVQTGEVLCNSFQGHTQSVLCVAYSPDGRFLASSSSDHTVRIWDAQTGHAIGTPICGHSRWTTFVAYSPDHRFLASCSEDRRIHVYDVAMVHLSSEDDARTRWLSLCSDMNREDGWVKDGETLLLWTPVPYRQPLRSRARVVINSNTPRLLTASAIDYDTLFTYSSKDWVKTISELRDCD